MVRVFICPGAGRFILGNTISLQRKHSVDLFRSAVPRFFDYRGSAVLRSQNPQTPSRTASLPRYVCTNGTRKTVDLNGGGLHHDVCSLGIVSIKCSAVPRFFDYRGSAVLRSQNPQTPSRTVSLPRYVCTNGTRRTADLNGGGLRYVCCHVTPLADFPSETRMLRW